MFWIALLVRVKWSMTDWLYSTLACWELYSISEKNILWWHWLAIFCYSDGASSPLFVSPTNAFGNALKIERPLRSSFWLSCQKLKDWLLTRRIDAWTLLRMTQLRTAFDLANSLTSHLKLDWNVVAWKTYTRAQAKAATSNAEFNTSLSGSPKKGEDVVFTETI